MFNTILALFLNGVFFGAGPCLASCGPLVLSYCLGTKKNSRESFKIWVLFSFGRIIIYITLGLLASIFSQLLLKRFYQSRISDYLFIIAGIFIFLIGIMMLFGQSIDFKFCKIFENHFIQKHKKGAFILGLILGILPCGPLLGILFYIALMSKNYIQGFLYSLSFGLGTCLSPLLALVIFAGAIPKLLTAKPKTYLIFKRVCAVLICYLGLSLASSVFK